MERVCPTPNTVRRAARRILWAVVFCVTRRSRMQAGVLRISPARVTARGLNLSASWPGKVGFQ